MLKRGGTCDAGAVSGLCVQVISCGQVRRTTRPRSVLLCRRFLTLRNVSTSLLRDENLKLFFCLMPPFGLGSCSSFCLESSCVAAVIRSDRKFFAREHVGRDLEDRLGDSHKLRRAGGNLDCGRVFRIVSGRVRSDYRCDHCSALIKLLGLLRGGPGISWPTLRR